MEGHFRQSKGLIGATPAIGDGHMKIGGGILGLG